MVSVISFSFLIFSASVVVALWVGYPFNEFFYLADKKKVRDKQ